MDIIETIKEQIANNTILLYMKGAPNAPQCGFSAKASQALMVDRGIGGATPGSEPRYIGMCHIYCNSIEDFEAGMGPHSKQINADITNYTDLIPEIQISEVRADVKTAP